VIVADNASYGGPLPNPPNNPRRFTGSVTYQMLTTGATNDAGAISIDAPVPPVAPGSNNVTATIMNFGTNQINSVTVNWAVDGVLQAPVSYTALLDTLGGAGGNTASVNLGSYNFPAGNNTITVWTSLPNGQMDTIPWNDTVSTTLFFSTPFSGTYTIGGSTADFQSFAGALDAMTLAGMNGPVTFSFDPAAGPYTGGVELSSSIPGSANNALTLQGNGSTINEGTPAHLIAIDGLSNVTIDNFSLINSDPAAANKFGIMIRGGAQHITITNNYIDMGTTSTSTATAGIVVSGSTTSATSTGNNAQYVTITNNEIVGGYYGITLYGNSSYQDNYGHVVADNVIRDWHYYGIRTQDADSITISRNEISRANRLSTYTIFYGIYNLRLRHSLISENQIHSTGPTTSSSYGIYTSASDNTAGYPTEYINNAIYNFTTTGLVYGIYQLGIQNYVNLYYNTVYIDAQGTSAKRGLWFSGTSASTPDNINLLNNIFHIEGSGSGLKYCIYMSANATNLISDYNVLSNDATAGTNHIGYWGSAQTTLADWQMATMQDGSSKSVNPVFPATDDFKSTSFDIYQAGTPLSNVTTDVFGTPRDPVQPCIGAYEFVLVQNDAGIAQLTEPLAICAGNQDVKVILMNYGISTLNTVTVEWSVNGVAQTPANLSSLGLAPSTSTEVILGSYTFLNNVPYDFVINTTMPNGVNDQQTDNDTLVVQGMLSGLAGTYTIGGGVADDFNSIADAVNEINSRGICGAVVFNVNPADGPYTGGVEIAALSGASAVHNIVFNGNGAVLNESLESYIIAMNGASHVTINDFQIINSDPSNNKMGIAIRGGSQHINITNNYIDMGTSSTSSATAGIIISGSASSALTAGNNAQYVTITDNEIVGGYYGITMYGNSNYQDNYGHVVADNIIRDWHYYGLRIQDGDSLQIARNNISRANRQSTYTIFYGMYSVRLRHSLVIDNHIHSTGPTTSSSYGIYHSASENSMGYEMEYINNAVYNFTTTGIVYGMYLLGTRDYVNLYHNTVQMEANGSSNARALWMSTAPNNHNIMNNIFSVEGPGTGTKYAIYASSTSTTMNADNNIYYMGATSGTNHLGYWGSDQTTLSDWQMATMLDGMSLDVNPVFAAPALLDITPLSASVDNMGIPVGVTTDIFGNPRSAVTPDIGAIEFTGIASDLALVGGELVNGECLSTNDSVYITFANVIGGTVNFSTATTTVYWNVTGPVNSSGSIVVNSGSLAPADEITVGGNGVDMSLPGIYILSAWLDANSVNLFAGNDSLWDFSSKQIFPIFSVDPQLVMITDPAETVSLSASSKFFPGGAFFISEICQYNSTAATGHPAGGYPSWLPSVDFIEITGVPNYDLGGYTLEQWSTTAMSDSFTFPAGTVLSPNGTAVIRVGSGSAGSDATNFYYDGVGSSASWSSTTQSGRIFRDGNGVIVDAVGYPGTAGEYTFPAAAGVTPADWTGNVPAANGTSGIRLAGPYTKSAANWVVANGSPHQHDPNDLNAGVTLPVVGSLTGFTWSHNGVVFATNVTDTTVGPWNTSGTYQYIAEYITPCGVLSDTVTVVVAIVTVSNDTTICEGETVQLYVDLPGTAPWTVIVTDGVNTDTISGIPMSPFSINVTPAVSTTYTVVGYMDASNVMISANSSTTVTVNPLPVVTINGFTPVCEYENPILLTGGLPTGGNYTGTGVNAGEFDPALAGVGTHTITYHFTDINGCANSADTIVEVNPAPVAMITGAVDTICLSSSVILDAGAGFNTYLWNNASTAQTIQVDGTSIGANNSETFTVTVTNNWGCSDQASVTITAIDCSGIEDFTTRGTLLIYPNPNNGNFTLHLTGITGKATLNVVKSTGELVKYEDLTLQGDFIQAFQMDNMAAGVYYIKIVTQTATITEKVVVK